MYSPGLMPGRTLISPLREDVFPEAVDDPLRDDAFPEAVDDPLREDAFPEAVDDSLREAGAVPPRSLIVKR